MLKHLAASMRHGWRIARSDRRRARILAQEQRYLALVGPGGSDATPDGAGGEP
jgi:hypothetical protein